MKTWHLVLIGIAVLAGVFIIVKVFGKNTPIENKYLDLLLKEKDKAIAKEAEYRIEITAMYNEVVAESRRKDSLLSEKSKVNTIRYEKVARDIPSLSHEELRSAVMEY